ncbi:hypothetical protein CDAR_573441 [Caerostris darwini]|uniref:Uncharacterized protein n=1 Tax=Caerostris darwini TaxID=1538125 RepID=A0AAV4VPJ4_9ARAC|nr:hypothetical protein CDAR_573441 [Caerostris darwini]
MKSRRFFKIDPKRAYFCVNLLERIPGNQDVEQGRHGHYSYFIRRKQEREKSCEEPNDNTRQIKEKVENFTANGKNGFLLIILIVWWQCSKSNFELERWSRP